MSRTSRTPATGQAGTASRRRHPLRSAITFFCIVGVTGSLAFLATSDFGANALDQGGTSVGGGSKRFVASVRIEPAELDFGEVQIGTTATGTVRVVNDGTRAVRITDIRTTCGCTVAERPQELIRPGESVEVKVRMSVDSAPGRVRRKSLTFDFGGQPDAIMVPVTSKSAEFVRIEPAQLIFDPTANGEVLPLTIAAADGKAFRILSVDPPLFTAPKNASTRHAFTIDSVQWKEIKSPRAVELTLDHPGVERITLPIRKPRALSAIRHGLSPEARGSAADVALTVRPRRIRLGRLAPGQEVIYDIYVTGLTGSASDTPPTIALDHDELTAEIVEHESLGDDLVLKVRFRNRSEANLDVLTALKIQSGDRMAEIPLQAFLRS